MASTALILVVIAAVAAGGAAGGVALMDVSGFEIELKVVDALSGEELEGAYVEIVDANGVLVATGYTDDDGEFEVEVDDDGADDSEDEDDESEDEIEQEDEVSLDSLAGPIMVTVSMNGYDTQTFTVDLDTLDDSDMTVELVPSA